MSTGWTGEKLFSSDKQDWSTPPALFSSIAGRWGPFTLDAAATPVNARCKRWLGPGGLGDALTDPWVVDGLPEGRVWVNPPYGRGVGQWVRRARLQAAEHGLTVACLTFARTDTRWWHEEIMPHAVVVELIKGRVVFTDPQGRPNTQSAKKTGKPRIMPAPAPSCIAIFSGERNVIGPPIFRSVERPKEAWDRPGWTLDT